MTRSRFRLCRELRFEIGDPRLEWFDDRGHFRFPPFLWNVLRTIPVLGFDANRKPALDRCGIAIIS